MMLCNSPVENYSVFWKILSVNCMTEISIDVKLPELYQCLTESHISASSLDTLVREMSLASFKIQFASQHVKTARGIYPFFNQSTFAKSKGEIKFK